MVNGWFVFLIAIVLFFILCVISVALDHRRKMAGYKVYIKGAMKNGDDDALQ